MSAVIRTCIGCRQRVEKTELVRVTVFRRDTRWVLRPDTGVAHQGRGAHLHPTVQCLELATRRNAFRRALRIEGDVDLAPLSVLIDDRQDPHDLTTRTAQPGRSGK